MPAAVVPPTVGPAATYPGQKMAGAAGSGAVGWKVTGGSGLAIEGAVVQVEQLARARDFLARTAEFRRADPVLTNHLATVATSVAAGREYAAEFWWVVTDHRKQVVGCSLRTSPHRLIVSPMPAAAAGALGRAVGAGDHQLPGISGPRPVVEVVAAAMVPPRRLALTMTDVIYVLGEYVRPRRAPGNARRAGRGDLDLLLAWYRQFGVDAGLPSHDVTASVLDRLEHAGLWLWQVNGTPVSMAGHAPVVPTQDRAVARIGPVYTPADLRGRGYGSAVTAAVVDELLPRCDTVMLFADAANAASNGIYRALGFGVAGEIVEADLADAADRATPPVRAAGG